MINLKFIATLCNKAGEPVMNKMANTNRKGLLTFSLAASLAFTQACFAQTEPEQSRCQTIQDCIDKYQKLIPEWQKNIKDFSAKLKEELPKIEQDFKSFGEEGEKQLRDWLDKLEKHLPEKQPDHSGAPETNWT
jgi:hypothetical protein